MKMLRTMQYSRENKENMLVFCNDIVFDAGWLRTVILNLL